MIKNNLFIETVTHFNSQNTIYMKTLFVSSFFFSFFVLSNSSHWLSCLEGSSAKHTLVSSVAKNYEEYCAGCHGKNLEKFERKEAKDFVSIDKFVHNIKYGLEDIGMPAFEKAFSDDEILALAKFVATAYGSGLELGSDTIPQKFEVETVVTGLDIPWGMAFLPNGDILITERSGTLHLFSNGKLSPPIQGVPEVFAINQGGLLDIALHPEYEKNGWIYFSYSAVRKEGGEKVGNTAIMRARLEGQTLKDQENIFQAEPMTKRGHHFGCKLAFDKENNLYFGVGDRGQHFDFPQKLDNHNGKIHKIRDDGSIPEDNPFVNTPGAKATIYSYGHRNPQGTSLHPETGELWNSEHGPKGGDELNLVKPGLNYGWPVISYGINYDGSILTELKEKEGMEQPVHYWIPSIAPCGMTFVTGDKYPSWKNNLFLGSLSFQYLERVVIKNQKVVHTEKLLKDIGRVRNVVQSPEGYLYVAVEGPGRILRLKPL